MERIGNEHAWVVQLIAENDGTNNHIIKGVWMGSKSSVMSVNYKMEEGIEVGLAPSGLRFSLEEDAKKTQFKTFMQTVPQSPYWLGGIIVPWRLKPLVYGTPKNMEEKIFRIISEDEKQKVPILRSWMPRIVEHLVKRGDLHKLITEGLEHDAYRLEKPSSAIIEEILIKDLDHFYSLAEGKYKESLAAVKAAA